MEDLVLFQGQHVFFQEVEPWALSTEVFRTYSDAQGSTTLLRAKSCWQGWIEDCRAALLATLALEENHDLDMSLTARSHHQLLW